MSPIGTVPKREYPSPRPTLTVKDLQTFSAFMLNNTQVSPREKQAGRCTGILLVPLTAPHKVTAPAFRSPCTLSTCVWRNKAWVCRRSSKGLSVDKQEASSAGGSRQRPQVVDQTAEASSVFFSSG